MCVVMQRELEGWGGGKRGILGVVQCAYVYLSIEPVTLGSYITSQLITMEAFLDRVGDNGSPLGCIQDRR